MVRTIVIERHPVLRALRPMLFLATGLVLASGSLQAPEKLTLPKWMQQAIGAERASQTTFYGSSTHHGTWLKEKRRPHRFIGAYTLDIIERDKAGKETRTLTVEGWQDSTRTVLKFKDPTGALRTAYMADLDADVAVDATRIPDITTSLYAERISKLVSREGIGLVMDAYYREQVPDSATGATRTLLGKRCEERVLLSTKRLRYWVDTTMYSPFDGMGRWLPLHQSAYTVLAPLSMHGKGMPMECSNEKFVLRMKKIVPGLRPRPSIDLSAYTIWDNAPRTAGTGADAKRPATSDEPLQEGSTIELKEPIMYNAVDKPPRYPGGEQAMDAFIAGTMRDPRKADEGHLAGSVRIRFVVERDGRLTHIAMDHSTAPVFDAEMIRVVSAMPNWEPGEHDGHVVAVRTAVTVNFDPRP